MTALLERSVPVVCFSWGGMRCLDRVPLPTSCFAPTAGLTTCGLDLRVPRFIGRVKQRPPQLSAVHVQGQRLHKVARDATQPVRFASQRPCCPCTSDA